MSALKKIEEQLAQAPSIKAMLQLNMVQERFIANYEAVTGKKDGSTRFQSEVFAYLEIVNEKPDLGRADRFSHFAAIIKAGTTGLSFRDNKLYVMPGPNNTVKVQSSPAGKREMLEMMQDILEVPEAQYVLKGDIFVHDKLNNLVTKHETTDKTPHTCKLEDIVASYQKVEWKDGRVKFVVVYKDDLLKARAKSPAKSEQSFWATYPGEAVKKVATNRAYRLYHRYPNNIVTYSKDEDDDEQQVIDTPHQEAVVEQPAQELVQEAKVVEEKKGIDDFLNS